MSPRPPLELRFRDQLHHLGIADPASWVVALSGGCDSVVLLHLLRSLSTELGLTLTAAHLDHGIRADSAEDARWVAALCAEWRIPLVTERLAVAPTSEDAARRARHAFLRDAAGQAEARWIALGHHADDQAETVLFRILRGTGLRGLNGMRPVTRAGLVRPLLPFWRSEIADFAAEHALRWRSDSTNDSLHPARNRIRHQLLPLAESTFAPSARRNLLRLAALSREAEGALERAARAAEGELVRAENGAFLLARGRIRDYDSDAGARVIRHLLRRFGVVLGRAGTRAALQFIMDAPSGRQMQLPDRVRVRIEFDVARIERETPTPPDETLIIGREERSGEAGIRLHGRQYRVIWRTTGAGTEAEGRGVALARDGADFPLHLRGWRPGDRMRTGGGTKTLKKLFLERRIPRSSRARLPVLANAEGRVLWVAEVATAADRAPGAAEEILVLSVLDA